MFNKIDELSFLIIILGMLGIIFFQIRYWIVITRCYKNGRTTGLEAPITIILNMWFITPIRIIGTIISLLLFDIPIILRIAIGLFGFSIINDGCLISMFIEAVFERIQDKIYFNKYYREVKIKNSSLKDSN